MANNTTGLTRIIKAAGYSWKGFRAAWINEAAFRQEGVAAIVAVIIACWLDVDAITRVLLIGSVLLVMIVEILNSAIEAVVDRIGSDFTSFLGARKIWDLRRCCWRLSRVITWVTLLWSHFR
jgi:diacylglycerol kinase (ATP)